MIKRTLLHFSFIIFNFFGTGLFGIDFQSRFSSNLQTSYYHLLYEVGEFGKIPLSSFNKAKMQKSSFNHRVRF